MRGLFWPFNPSTSGGPFTTTFNSSNLSSGKYASIWGYREAGSATTTGGSFVEPNIAQIGSRVIAVTVTSGTAVDMTLSQSANDIDWVSVVIGSTLYTRASATVSTNQTNGTKSFRWSITTHPFVSSASNITFIMNFQ